MSEKKEFGKARLLTAVELAKELGCDRKRIYYLKKIGKLGYECFERKDNQWVFLYDEPYRKIVEGARKYADLTELEKGINAIVRIAEELQKRIKGLNEKFTQDEKRLLMARDELKA